MSADNGYYVLPTQDGFYVAGMAAVDNLTYDGEESLNGYSREFVNRVFARAPSFSDEKVALDYARTLENQQWSEYGPVLLPYYPEKIEQLQQIHIHIELTQEERVALREFVRCLLTGYNEQNSVCLNPCLKIIADQLK